MASVAERRRARLALALAAAALALLLAARPAAAKEDAMLVREVYAGVHDDSFVVLQAYQSGQDEIGGHALTAYAHYGGVLGSQAFSGDLGNLASQMTVLVADTGYATRFPKSPAPNMTMPSLDLSPAGGAVCWEGQDCISWGAFIGTTSPPTGRAAPQMVDGLAVGRSIEGGCPTMLEQSDDTDDSSADFLLLSPGPRSNSSPSFESACDKPTVAFTSKPPGLSTSTSAQFAFHSTPPGAELECRLDFGDPFPCDSGSVSYNGTLAELEHTFQARVKSGTPAPYPWSGHTWTIDLTPPQTTIESPLPANPTPGPAITFYFSASEPSAVECSLELTSEPDDYEPCSTQWTYSGLPDGEYAFRVRATDPANLQGAPATYHFTLDSSLADIFPPETTITSHPPDPTPSPNVAFTYASSEQGSTFECRLDGGAFSFCPADGVGFDHLAAGPHLFEARAKDAKKNIDPTPAAFAFSYAPPPAPGPGPGAGQVALGGQTKISARPKARTHDRTPTLRFFSLAAGATFECQIDGRPFAPCRSPLTTKRLPYGKHTFRVRAVLAGAADPTPAACAFRVLRRR